MNIVDVIKNSLSNEVLGQLGSLVGASPEQTKTAAGAAVPAILAGLKNTASTKGDVNGMASKAMVTNACTESKRDRRGRVKTSASRRGKVRCE
ncbi:MAG TPA: DUF937 domain-containing protein [Gemmatales bacterium]|nr:DUF937 domain-containing protein [Gemmatales bacterium]